MNKKILLIHMPIASAEMPNLAIERLAAILKSASFDADVLYGTLRFWPYLPYWLHGHGAAPIAFAPSYYGEPAKDWLVPFLAATAEHAGEEVQALEQLFYIACRSAEKCLSDCMHIVEAGDYDAIGLSIGFDSQRMPSAALARMVKAKFPNISIVAGGTACDGIMGETLLELFPCFDAIVDGEADATIVSIFNALTGDADVPANTRLRVSPGRPAQPPLKTQESYPDLGHLPLPDFESFNTQVARSEYSRISGRMILYEGSRGCWYGQKNHCTFCGIRNVDAAYRTVESEQFLEDIAALDKNWRPETIYLTDAILSRQFFSEVLPMLRDLRRRGDLNAKLFAETKSNLTPQEVHALAEANIKTIQPGIESLITATLQKMRKGASGIQQIELLKWCKTFDIDVIYGLMLEIPGETHEDLQDLADICELLHHLPAPAQAGEVQVHRFSPYFNDPQKYGIDKIVPHEYQRQLYRCDDQMLLRLCYEFTHSMNSDARYHAAKTAVKLAVQNWQASSRDRRALTYTRVDDGCVIFKDVRGAISLHKFEGAHAYVLDGSHRPVTHAKLHINSEYSEEEIRQAVEELCDMELVIQMDNRLMNLAIPTDIDDVLKRSERPVMNFSINKASGEHHARAAI